MTNVCRLQTTINKEATTQIYKFIYEDHEVSGTISLEGMGDNKKEEETTDKKYKSASKISGFKKGEESSVSTKNDIYNYHIHPLVCYIKGDCVFGWLSGEDIKSCLQMALKGNKAHFVFSLEGVYVMSIKSDFLTMFQELYIDYRVIILNVIEDYFKSSHEYRTKEHLLKFKAEFYKDLPSIMVNVINSCTLQKLVGETIVNNKTIACKKTEVINEEHMKKFVDDKYKKEFKDLASEIPPKLKTSLIFNCQFFPSNLYKSGLFTKLQTPKKGENIFLDEDIVLMEVYPKHHNEHGKNNCSMEYLKQKINYDIGNKNFSGTKRKSKKEQKDKKDKKVKKVKKDRRLDKKGK